MSVERPIPADSSTGSTPRTVMPTSLPVETEGTIYRADFLTSKIYHVRWARLNGSALEVYKGEHLQPEHTFQLAGCKLSCIRAAECDVKPQGVNLFKGYVTGQIETKELHVLKIKISKAHSRASSKLILGFETPEEANRWLSAISKSLGHRSSMDATHTGVRFDRSMLATQDGTISGVLEDQETSQAEMDAKKEPLLPEKAPTNPSSRWKSELHWDGLAVYREAESNTYATCCTMRASPRCVFQHLVHLADGSSAWTFFQDCEVLGKAPDDADGLVFHAQPRNGDGMLSWLGVAHEGHVVPPRDVVVQQSWSFREPSGVFTISYHSVDHPDAPAPAIESWTDYIYHWRSPVRAQVQRLAFTISPLNQSEWNSEGREPEDSPECMVTVLVQADLGGSLADSSFVRPVLRPLSLVWLASLIRSIVHVRETVEQKRFVEPLFSLLGHEGGNYEKATEPLWRRAAAAAAASTRMSFSAGNFVSGTAAAAAAAAASGDGTGLSGKIPSGAGMGGDGDMCGVEEDYSGDGNGVDDLEDPKPWLPARFFSSPDASAFNVRSGTYLKNKQKQKSAPAAFRLTALEALITPAPETHISPYLPIVTRSSAPFLMPIHFTLPYGGKPMHLVCVFEADRDPTDEEGDVDDEDEPFARALAEFVAGASEADDKRRNTMLKMIPMLKEGSWLMRQTMGSTPVIIGTKIGTSYHRGPNYLEVTVDISSNSTAASIANMVAGAVSSLSIWLAFVLEGKRAEHLPERLLGSVCIDHLDLACAKFIDTTKPPTPVPHALRIHRPAHSTSSTVSTDASTREPLTQRRNPITSTSTSVPASSPTSGLAMLPLLHGSGSGEFGFGPTSTAARTSKGSMPGQYMGDGNTMVRASAGSMSGSGGHAPLGVAIASSTPTSRRLDGGSPVASSTVRTGRSAPFELVEAPQKQALVAGAVGEGKLDSLPGTGTGMNVGVPPSHLGQQYVAGVVAESTERMRASKAPEGRNSRNESQEIFHDVCEGR